MTIVRFPPRLVLLLFLPAYLLLAVLASYAGYQAIGNHEPAVAVPAFTAAAAAIFGAGVTIRVACQRVSLTESVVIAPRILHRTTVLSLDQVAGIGLHYAAAGRGSAWNAFVWPAQGRRIRLTIAAPSFSAPKGSRGRLRPRPGTAPALDWAYVADSPAGRAAIAIAQRVEAIQGPNGRWATMRREESTDSPGGADTAFWSPSGRVGVLRGARPASGE